MSQQMRDCRGTPMSIVTNEVVDEVFDPEGKRYVAGRLIQRKLNELEKTRREAEDLTQHHADYHAYCSARQTTCPHEAEVLRLRGMIEQADIEGWTVKGLKGATAALHGEGEKP